MCLVESMMIRFEKRRMKLLAFVRRWLALITLGCSLCDTLTAFSDVTCGPHGAQNGILVGGLADGGVVLWSVDKILGKTASDPLAASRAQIARLEKHTGPVRDSPCTTSSLKLKVHLPVLQFYVQALASVC